MKIVATRGGNVYVLQLGDQLGQILDLNLGKLFPPQDINIILTRGYWEEYRGDQTALSSLLAQVNQDQQPDFSQYSTEE